LDETSTPSTTPVKTNHVTGFWFILWGEFAERCSYYGMRAILALYMTEELGFSKADGGTFMSLFIAACYFLPLLGGYLADNFFGKYWTIVSFSVPYVIGQFLVGFPNQYVLFAALALLAMGAGVIKPNISTLMGLTYDQQRPGQDQLRSSAFSWFYFSINIGAALSQTVLPIVRDKHGYQIAFMVPAFFMALALFAFAMGKKYYAVETIGLAKTLTPAEKTERWKVFSRIAMLFILVMFFWAIFDQSASTWIFFADTYMDCTLAGESANGGTVLCSGETVFAFTSFLAGIFSPVAELFGAKPLNGSRTIDPSADAIQAFNAFFIITLLPFVLLFFKTLDKKGIKIRPTEKMIVGFILTGVTMLIMGFAGLRAGKQVEGLKIAFEGGEVIIPSTSIHAANSAIALDSSDIKFDRGVIVYGDAYSVAGMTFIVPQSVLLVDEGSSSGGKTTFKDATFYLPDGRTLVFSSGKLDVAKSKKIFDGGKIDLGFGVRWKFSSGEYQRGEDKIVIDQGKATVKTGEKVAAKDEEKVEAGQKKKDHSISIAKVEYVNPKEQVSVWWQVLAYLILTIAEILISVTGLELAFVVAPKSMTSFVTGCWLLTVALANLLINAPLSRLYPVMHPAVYFFVLAGAMGVVTFLFLLVARRFNKAMAEKDLVV